MVSAHYTRHMKGHVSLRDLYGLCVNARTYSRKSLAVWMQQIWWSGNKCRNTLPVYFPESLCERGFRETTSVQENVVLANIKALDLCVCGCMYTHAITLTHTHIYSYKLCENYQTLSRGNSYVFYEVANLYEFVWPHSYDLVQFV